MLYKQLTGISNEIMLSKISYGKNSVQIDVQQLAKEEFMQSSSQSDFSFADSSLEKIDPYLPAITIFFDEVIAMQVLDRAFSHEKETVYSEWHSFRRHTGSDFLQYVLKETFVKEFMQATGETIEHYEIVTTTDVISVVSSIPPVIKLIFEKQLH